MARYDQQQRNRPGMEPEIADGGWGWFVLLGAFLGQLLVSGTLLNIGLYLVEWQRYFSVGAEAVSTIATIMLFTTHFIAVCTGALCKQFGCRALMMAGATLNVLTALLGSFATKLWQLYIFGVFWGLGVGLAYLPTVVIIGYYFKKRLGFANGVTYGGIGAGVLVIAPVTELLCSHYGWRGALLVQSAINANLMVCAVLFRPSKAELRTIREYRAKINAQAAMHTAHHSLDAPTDEVRLARPTVLGRINETFALSSLLKNRGFVTFMFASLLHFWGYLSTLVFIAPKMVYDLGTSKLTASLAMSVFGICSLLARLLHGFLLDYHLITAVNLYIITVIGCGLYPLFGPFVMSVIGQFFFIVFFGLTSGTMNAMLSAVCRQYVPIEIIPNALGLLISFCAFGVLTGSHLMGKIYDLTGSYDVPLHTNGVVLVLAGLLMFVFTRCSRSGQGQQTAANAAIDPMDTEGAIQMVVPPDEHNGLAGYKAVKTNETVA